MKLHSLRFVGVALAALFSFNVATVSGQQPLPEVPQTANQDPVEQSALQQVRGRRIVPDRPKPEPAKLDRIAEKLKVAEPVTHANLAVMFIEGEDQMDTSDVLTLDEALKKKGTIEVTETGNVNELTVRNMSLKHAVFIMAGDIVKGGKQDRTIAMDLPLRKGDGIPTGGLARPGTTGVPIASFCVEHGRWQARAGSSVEKFDSSGNALASKEQKIAVRSLKDQSKVWDSVAKAQTKISGNVGKSVNAAVSPTSLQLSLEDKELKKQTGAYLDALKPMLGKSDKAIGFVLVINGQINSAEIFASHELLTRVWPKLIESAAIEAISELKGKQEKAATAADAMEFLAKAEDAAATQEQIHESYWNVNAESPGLLLFRTIDRAKDSLWLRRSIIKK